MDYEGTRETETEVTLGDAALTRALPELAAAASAAAQTGGIPLVPDANNTVVLPQGATLDDITVQGRDLVIRADDGRTYVIADGAVFVPQIVAQGVTVPPLNLAALLIGHEPEPAAGPVRSSGNNFAVPVGAIQDAYKIGNLLPYTELKFPEPQQREIFPAADRKPITGPNADVQLDDDSLPGGNPGGVGDVSPDTANTSGHLAGSGGDGALTWALSTDGAPAGFSYVANGSGLDVFQGEVRVIAITLDPATGAYTVTQLAPVMHVAGGDENNQGFTLSYAVTDADGDRAAGTIAINVNDDTPIANPDTDTIAAGQFGPATGNILTDAAPGDAGDGDNGADHVGADGGLALVSISGFGGAGTIGGTTQGHYGTLTLGADGNYSYVRAAGTPGGVTDTFTYTIRDADGDTSTTTLTITTEDAKPIAGENALVQLDDDALAGGNPGGVGDVSPDTANTTGTLAASGGDGALTWAFATTGAPSGFSYVANGTGIDVFQGETKVIAITLNSATGAYTVTQLAPVVHAPGGDENGQTFSIGYSATDIDGDPASGTLTINVNDDTPTVSANGEAPALVVDETNLATNATADLSTLFTHSFGADGPAANNSVTYALGAVAGPSGLIDTLTGQTVNLSLVGGVVEGRTTGGLLVFTVAVDAAGNVTLDQNRAVVHDPNLGPNDVAALTANLVTLTQTVTDGDGDHASASAAIGGMLQFVDDAPSAANDTNTILGGETTANGNVITGTVPDGVGKDTLGADGGSVTGVVSNNLPDNSDTTLDASGNLVVHGAFGVLTLNADGTYTYVRDAGTPGNSEDVFTYTVTDGDGDKATATLTIVIDDARPVTGPNALVQLDDDALAGGNPGGVGDVDPDTAHTTGTLAASGGDGALTWALATTGAPAGFSYVANGTGIDVFQGTTKVITVTLDTATGAYVVSQIAPVMHAAGGDENNTGLTLTYTVTDADGDPATGTLNISVNDDTPTVSATRPVPNLTVDETNFAVNATQDLSGVFTHSFGADGAAAGGGVAYALGVTAGPSGLVDTLTGSAVALAMNGTVVEGRTSGGLLVFTVSVDATGHVTLDQSRAVVHDPNLGPNDVAVPGANLVTLTQTVTDGDGDSASATVGIGDHLQFVDDAPSAGGNLTAFLNEDFLSGGNLGGPGDNGAQQNLSGVLSHSYGSDGGSIAFATTGAPAGFQYVASGSDVLIQQNQGGTMVTVVTVTLNSATGAYTVTLNAPVIHAHTLASYEENQAFTLNYTVTDGDGDKAGSSLVIVVNDDTPVAVNDVDSVTEDGPSIADGNVFTGTGGSDANTTDGVKDSIGADGAAIGGPVTAVAFGTTTGTVGTALAGTYGSLVLNSDGSYTYTLDNTKAAVQALGAGDTRTEVFTYTITDRDGDTSSATLKITVNGTNDAPVVTPASTAVSEEGLRGGNPDTVGNTDTTNSATASGTLVATDVDSATLTYTLGTPATALTSGGAAVTWTGAGTGTLTGSVGTTPIITVTIDGSGHYTVTLLGHVDHASTTTEDALNLVVPVNVSDGIATTPTTLTVSIEDDSPIATTGTTSGTVDEDGLSGGIEGGIGDVPGTATTATGSVTGLFSMGADTPGHYELTAPAGLPSLTSHGVAVTYSVTGNVLTAVAGASPIFTLTLNGTTGAWTFQLQGPIDHPQGLDENNLTLNFAGMVQAVDADGDRATATGTFSVIVNDDTPVAHDDATTQATENAPVTINVFANDQGGADGTLASTTTLVAGSLHNGAGAATGTLVNNHDGTFTYTPGAGEEGTITFQYTITDRDGDPSQATATITLLPDSVPQPVAVVASVDDDGLSGGNPLSTVGDIDANIGDLDGLASSEASFRGQMTVNFGGDTGTVSFANLNGTTGTVGTEMVNYAWDALTNTLTATGPRGALFTVSLTPSGSYTVTLLDNVLHASGGNETSTVVTLNYLAADSDGDNSTAGTLAITFNDDAPTAVDDGVTQATENSAVTINVFANDHQGADGVLASTTTLVAGSLHNGAGAATGTLVNNHDGTFTYTPGSGESGTVSFQYTITDADGDSSQATASITLLPDSVPQVVNAVAAVDDDALAGGNPGGVGDIDANLGEPGATPSEAIYTGSFTVNFGNDTGTVSFANLNGTTGTVGTETVSYAWDAGTHVLTATGPRGALFTVSLSASGAYTVTLLDNVLHAAGGNETSTVVNLNYLAADSDGSASTAGQLAITFNDDTPTLGTIQNQQASNDPTQTPAVGTLHFSTGADGLGSSMTIGADLTGITSGGHALVTQQDGNVLTAYADLTGNGFTSDDTKVFTLTVNPLAGTSGQYSFDLIAPLDTTTTNASIGGATAFGAGPTGTQILSSGTTSLAVVSGWSVGSSFDAAHWFDGTNTLPGGLTLSNVNGSTGGWGVQNQNFNGNEFMRFDFGSPMDDFDGSGPYTAPSVTLPEISYATFNLIGFGSTETLQFRVHYTDGTSSNASVNGAQTGYTLSAPAGKYIDWIDIYGPNVGNGSGKISLTDVGVTSTTIDKTLPFTLQLTDGDGDPTATGSFSVHVQTGATPLAPAAPIAVDLNGDGVHYLAADAGVTFDYTGSGEKVATAWVDGHDGLLAIDANHSGSVDSGSEIVFGGNGLTDLQGLAATYDTNHDGVLDAQDAAFAQFGVWQDANSNGVADAGEFKTLTELGIASINLTSDGQATTAAGGDVTVFGTTTFTRADGTTGTAADVAFATSALQRQAQPTELAAVSAAAAGLLAAMALDHANASADTGMRTASAHTMDLPVAAAQLSPDLPDAATQPASILLSTPMAAKVAALAELHGRADLAETARDHAALDRLADHGADKGTGDAQAAAKSALFAAPDAGHAAMDALLTTTATPAEAKAAAPAQPVVAEALADAADNHAVDHIVDHFAATGTVELGASPKAGDFALQGLLDSSVQGAGHDAGAAHFNLMQALDHEQAAAMA